MPADLPDLQPPSRAPLPEPARDGRQQPAAHARGDPDPQHRGRRGVRVGHGARGRIPGAEQLGGVNRPDADRILLVGHPVAAATHRTRDFLTRNERPFRFVDVERDPDGRRMAERFAAGTLPLVVLSDGRTLTGPANADLVAAIGLATTASRPHYDLIVVGPGPAGLGAAVYAASEGLATLLVDADTPGGQAGTSSRIENYLGFPSGVSGADLARRAVTQARRFGVEILNPVRAVALRRSDPARILTLDDGTEVGAETVLLATGVQYNRLAVPGTDRFEGQGLLRRRDRGEHLLLVVRTGAEVVSLGGAERLECLTVTDPPPRRAVEPPTDPVADEHAGRVRGR